MKVIEQFSIGKSTTTPSEDDVVVTTSYAAVIDGATAKTGFMFNGEETPGHIAARLLHEAIVEMPYDLQAEEAISRLTKCLNNVDTQSLERPTASVIIYSSRQREVWMVGDCQLGLIRSNSDFSVVANPKKIDKVLSEWRKSIITSFIIRGLISPEEVLSNDPGRRIIQPFITRQVLNHNHDFGVLDGTDVPSQFIKRIPITNDISAIILASDGYPILYSTLEESETRLKQLLKEDPLCIGPLLGTKGMQPKAQSFDDRTYLKLEI